MKWILLVLVAFLCSCAVLPKRAYRDDKMYLRTEDTEWVPLWKVDNYVDDIMESAKGYEKPKESPAVKKSINVFVGMSAGLFLVGVVCFLAAALTKLSQAGTAGFISWFASAVALGVAELARWWWVIPVIMLIGGIVWGLTHRYKDFSIVQWVKTSWRRHSTSE